MANFPQTDRIIHPGLPLESEHKGTSMGLNKKGEGTFGTLRTEHMHIMEGDLKYSTHYYLLVVCSFLVACYHRIVF